ncbi:hypothetical protein DNX69_09435 [Rhodopseudomonas palustris]|uniref:DUF2232 domain-containing protein n=1 Tax=Rhodopseudomonas palustris TaxID=1076 RepID=A0A323UIW9_RHOPL|nr:hypothetical protein [Rhodopseudomonas palustris]PZA12217.1 hypothetical protein DNX69_09435 [Rhodopseudomonas palustris]
MMINILIALAAGCASALMFASIVSGALISLLLFYLAPLPLMVAAFGWGVLAAAIGGLVAAIGLAALVSFPYAIAFVVTIAVPACWLGHLALLARPAEAAQSEPAALEWYPIGRLVVWMAGFAATTTMAALFTLGADGSAINDGLRNGLQRTLGPGSTPGSDAALVDALVTIAPPAAATVAMLTLTLNLWLAAKITSASNRLGRPWPDLRTVTLPPMTLAVLSLALALSFVGGLTSMFGKTASAALFVAYGLTGAATLHTITMASRSRLFLLSSAYALMLIFVWPAVGLVALGLGDAFLNLRQRYFQRRSMPPPPTH